MIMQWRHDSKDEEENKKDEEKDRGKRGKWKMVNYKCDKQTKGFQMRHFD